MSQARRPPVSLPPNNLDLLRFALATVVFLVHCHVLSNAPVLANLSAVLSSDLAVKAFFVVSGLLVTMSFERSTSLWDYAERRLRRIYPAYATVVIGAAVLLVFISTVSWVEYFSAAWWRYLGANLIFANFLQRTLPGVFTGHAMPDVNGALWTLKIEVMFYAAVPAIVWAVRRWGPSRVLPVVYMASAIYVAVLAELADRSGWQVFTTLSHQMPGQLMYFVGGAALYYALPTLTSRWIPLAGLGLAAFAADRLAGASSLTAVWLAILVGLAAFAVPRVSFGRRGDLSYGIYVLHFPVVQVLVAFGAFRASPWLAVIGATALVMAGAFALWHFVERPWLRRSSHYVGGISHTSPLGHSPTGLGDSS